MDRVGAPEAVIEPLRDQQPGGPNDRAPELTPGVIELVVMVRKRIYERGAVDHHQADRYQDADHRQQRVVGFAFGCVEHFSYSVLAYSVSRYAGRNTKY